MAVARKRCAWAKNPLAIAYHDREWGVPVREDRRLFELLILEGAQAGLSWDTILAKRENYRRAFAGFDPRKVARFGARERRRLLADPGIVRNRAKIDAAVNNARRFLEVQKAYGSFARYAWGFVGGAPLPPRARRARPSRTPVSDALSKDLKRRAGVAFLPYVPFTLKSLKQKKPDAEPRTLGEHVRRCRLEHHLTQRALAGLLGISPEAIRNWENGRTEPAVEFVPAAVRFLGYDPFPEPRTLSERLLAKRRAMGLSIRAAARSIGVRPETWKRWEEGASIRCCSHRALVARLLDLPIGALGSSTA